MIEGIGIRVEGADVKIVIEDDDDIGVTGLVDVAAAEGVAVDEIEGAVML